MGSWHDLKQEQIGQYNDLLSLYKSGKPYVSPLEQSVMIDLFKEHGFERMHATITQACLNGWIKVDKVKMLASLFKRYGAVKTQWAIDRMNALENHSLDTVQGILEGRIAPYRGKKDEPKAAVQVQYPTEDHLYDQAAVRSWMLQRNRPLDAATEFFDIAGVDPNNQRQIYRLKGEYR